MTTPDLSDAEVDRICSGLTQNAAKVRYLRDVLHLPVARRPNGRPLVRRADWERAQPPAHNGRPASGPKWRQPA